ncbi:hypothetical protein HPB50_007978 [Hyalomma asiaticum]|uniref:Uncharacterized protein n=1 Tax=Hyalomma asiaticum TaxID=266040 RepID=A0ACB7RXH8_HYAAI|nr:hypothetical protein HPB50_007978 [Hyalomma asiaticum]
MSWYIVCKWRRPDTKDIEDYMYELCCRFKEISSVTSQVDIVEVVPLEVINDDAVFTKYIRESNDRLGRAQITHLTKIRAFAQNSDLYEGRQSNLRKECLKMWKVPDLARLDPKRPPPDAKFKELTKNEVSYFEKHPDELKPKFLESIKSLHDYRCVVCGERKPGIQDNKFFFLSAGRKQVYQWTGMSMDQWKKVTESLELPPDTLFYGEMVQEFSGEGRQQKRFNTIHVIDALVLGKVSVKDKHYDERMKWVQKFAKALSKPSRSDLTPLRAKEVFKLQDVETLFDRITLKLEKGAAKNLRLSCTVPQEQRDREEKHFSATGVLFYRTTKVFSQAVPSAPFTRQDYETVDENVSTCREETLEELITEVQADDQSSSSDEDDEGGDIASAVVPSDSAAKEAVELLQRYFEHEGCPEFLASLSGMEPWHEEFSTSSQRPYFYNTMTRKSNYEMPKYGCAATFKDCFQAAVIWSWVPGIRVLPPRSPSEECPNDGKFVSEFERDVPGSIDTARANVQRTTSNPTPVLEPMHELLVSLVPKPLIGAFEDVSEPAVKVEPVRDVIGGPYWETRATAPRAARVAKDVEFAESDWPDGGANRRASEEQPVRGWSAFADEDRARKPHSASKPSPHAAYEVTAPSSESFGPVQESGLSSEPCELPYMASVFGEDFAAGGALVFLRSGYASAQKPGTSIFTLSRISEGDSSTELARKTPGFDGRPKSSPLPISTGWTIWDRPPSIEDTMTPAEKPADLTWIFVVMIVVAVVLMVTMYVSYVVNMARLEKARAAAVSKPTFPTEEMW